LPTEDYLTGRKAFEGKELVIEWEEADSSWVPRHGRHEHDLKGSSHDSLPTTKTMQSRAFERL
jgi:hypothetical protein